MCKKGYECQLVEAEDWDDDNFQDYYYDDGTRVPAGEVVGVEIKEGDRGWKLYLLDEINYPN